MRYLLISINALSTPTPIDAFNTNTHKHTQRQNKTYPLLKLEITEYII